MRPKYLKNLKELIDMNLEQIKGMLDLQYGVTNSELILDNGNQFYFRGIDNAFLDEIEVKVHTADGETFQVYTRFYIEGVDVDETIKGVSDEYEHRGQLMKPLSATILD